MKKIAIINQRYGEEVNGGSEYYTRLIANSLKKYYDIEILTTTALDYSTWGRYYPEGISWLDGIKIRRFNVKRERNIRKFELACKMHRLGEKLGISLDSMWVKEQGPYVPDLIRYIEENVEEYEKFIFVTYLYYPTVIGIRKVFEKSILIPTAHDEPYIYYDIYKEIFEKVSGIIYLTEEEKMFVEKTFQNQKVKNTIAAIGIDIDNEMENTKDEEIRKFKEKYDLKKEYIIYAGRVDVSKGCDEMFSLFQKYIKDFSFDYDLVVIGKTMIEIPHNDRIHYLGFVSDEEKNIAIAGAKFLWLPSKFESLSIALLEGFALGIPGIVNGKCEVLNGHAQKSKAAFSYKNWEEFTLLMDKIKYLANDEYNEMSEAAKNYVSKNYTWNQVEKKVLEVIEGEKIS